MAKKNTKKTAAAPSTSTIDISDVESLLGEDIVNQPPQAFGGAKKAQAKVRPPQGFGGQAKQQKVTQTMEDLGLDDATLESVLSAVSAPKAAQPAQAASTEPEQEGDARGVGVFKKYEPKAFKQLAESDDGKIAITVETRDWEMKRGKSSRSGTSTKIHIRSKYVDNKGERVYGYDLASFPNEKETLVTVAGLLSGVVSKLA